MKRQNLTSLIRLSCVVLLSLLMILFGGLLKSEMAHTVLFGAKPGPTPPSITAIPINRSADNMSLNSQVATIDDVDDALDTLTVTVNGAMSATVNGVTVTLNALPPNTNGQVFADVFASCAATTANFTLRVTDSSAMFSEATLTFTVFPDIQPPTVNCPNNITAVTPTVDYPCAVVTFTATASDNCPGVTPVCVPPSGCFPLGTTTVTCTATDMSGNFSICHFNVTVFNIRLQDDTDSSILFLGNSITGSYRFCCQGTVFTGVAQVNPHGQDFTFLHSPQDRRLCAKVYGATFKGTASLQSPPATMRCMITDMDTRNDGNICQ